MNWKIVLPVVLIVTLAAMGIYFNSRKTSTSLKSQTQKQAQQAQETQKSNDIEVPKKVTIQNVDQTLKQVDNSLQNDLNQADQDANTTTQSEDDLNSL